MELRQALPWTTAAQIPALNEAMQGLSPSSSGTDTGRLEMS